MVPIYFTRNLTTRWLAVLLAMAVLLAACSTPAPAPATGTPEPAIPTPTTISQIEVDRLYNTLWILVGYGDPGNPTVVDPGLRISAEFTPEGQISGFGGCNNYSGTFEASADGTLSLSPLATTLMACPQGMELESAYLDALQNPQGFAFSPEGRLEIKYLNPSGEEHKLVYASGQATLTENVWVMLSYGDPNSPQTVPPGILLTANFSVDGNMSGFSGCNSYNVGYATQDGEITLGPVASTMMACPTGMEEEQAYLEALGSVQNYEIKGNALTLTYNQGTEALNYTAANLPLEHSLWTLAAVDGQPLQEDVQITASFVPGQEAKRGTVGGSSGCNNYNAGYSLEGANITIEPAISTRMACPTGMDTEQTYLQALEAAQSYEIFADRLLLRTASGTLTFAANRTPLAGALWVLVALGDINDPQPPVQGSNFTAQFMHDPDLPSGLLTGATGCNEYATAYAASLDQIKINPPASTENTSCAPGLVDQEQLYYLALSDASSYRISGNSLVIPYDSDRQALVFVGTQLNVAQRAPLSDLNNTTWFLWYLNNQPLAAGTTISAQFRIDPNGASGSMNGLAGCNNYVANFGDSLGMQTYLNARETCPKPAGVMEQERNYLQVLARTYGYWLGADQLVLNSGQGVLTYRQTRPPESYDQTHLLVGANWYLVAYNNTYSVPGTREPYTLFNEDGTLTGYTGCNDFQGTYQTDINQITIADLSQTEVACPDRASQAQEDALLDILGSARSYQLADTAMQIIGDSGVLNYSLTPINRPDEIQPPSAVIQAPEQALVGEVVLFDGSASSGQLPIVAWNWDFGDGVKGTGSRVQHVYQQPGSYYVQMTVTDQQNYRGSRAHNILVISREEPTPPPSTPEPTPTTPPEVTQTPEPTQPPEGVPSQAVIQGPSQGFAGEPLTFDASGSQAGDSPISAYIWDFGDGTSAGPGAESQQTTIFNHTGVYQVAVVVTDENGLSSSATMEVSITTRLDTPLVWTLDQLMNEPLLPGTAITLQFLEGEIAGFAGCNTYQGNYTASQNEDGSYDVMIEELAISRLACPDEIMKQEAYYLAFLQTATKALIDENLLDLGYPAGIGPEDQPYPEGVMNFYEIGTALP
ncbi:MAG: META domain-containing protein [Anaerolineales bacterium]|jgi:heat shock protein HslJ